MTANNRLRFKRLVRVFGYKCMKCQNLPLMNNMLTVDHIVPRNHGTSIIHDYIEKGDPEFRNVTQMRFEIKDGFFRYEARDNSGDVVKSFMTALSYIHTIETRREEPPREPGMPMHKLSKEEKRKAR